MSLIYVDRISVMSFVFMHKYITGDRHKYEKMNVTAQVLAEIINALKQIFRDKRI